MFIPSSSATLFLCRRLSIGRISLHSEIVYKQESREGTRVASLEHMGAAEECVELYRDAIETGREQAYSMRVTSQTSILKDRQGDESSLSCSVVARSPKEASDGFVGYTVISGNLAQGVVVFHDAAYHFWPFFRWDTMLRLTWTRKLL